MHLLPERLLSVTLRDGRALPAYLTERDHGWVERLQDAVLSLAGRPRHEVDVRLDATPLPEASARARRAMTRLLLSDCGFRVAASRKPREVRATVFRLAGAQPDAPRAAILEEAGRQLHVPTAEVAGALYADLPERRVLQSPSDPPSPARLILRYNLVLAQSLLLRARDLTVQVHERIHPLLRFARLQRLLVEARSSDHDAADAVATLRISGPLSLFRFTLKYGRAMARWLPALTRHDRWRLEATCVLDGEAHTFVATDRDPLATTHIPPRRFDSAVERWFFRDLARLDTPWEVLRESDPVSVDGRLLCPDFTLVDPARDLRVPVEIVGFWTPDYLAHKRRVLAHLPTRWLLCVDRDLAAHLQDAAPPEDVFPYRRRVDAAAFVAWVEERLRG